MWENVQFSTEVYEYVSICVWFCVNAFIYGIDIDRKVQHLGTNADGIQVVRIESRSIIIEYVIAYEAEAERIERGLVCWVTCNVK